MLAQMEGFAKLPFFHSAGLRKSLASPYTSLQPLCRDRLSYQVSSTKHLVVVAFKDVKARHRAHLDRRLHRVPDDKLLDFLRKQGHKRLIHLFIDDEAFGSDANLSRVLQATSSRELGGLLIFKEVERERGRRPDGR